MTNEDTIMVVQFYTILELSLTQLSLHQFLLILELSLTKLYNEAACVLTISNIMFPLSE